MNGVGFQSDVAETLVPTLEVGDVMVLDNLPAHKFSGIAVIIEAPKHRSTEARGARLVYLPPFSAAFPPIGRCWSQVKTRLRKAKARSQESLEAAPERVIATITTSDAPGWFRHWGYA